MSQSFRQKYFGSKSFYSDVIAIAVPVMAQMLIQSLVSLVDNFMVAELGDVKPPLVISVSATLINTFLDWVYLQKYWSL